MQKKKTVLIIIVLLILSALIYTVQLIYFRKAGDTLFYILQDLAFLPLQIAVVTLIIGKIINEREKRERLSKINMMISAFFSEVGTELIKFMASFTENSAVSYGKLDVSAQWTAKDFSEANDFIRNYSIRALCPAAYLKDLKDLLNNKRLYLYIMLSNPTLLEHESFTDMLLAVFHKSDELTARSEFESLPESDIIHLNADISRAFTAVVSHWLQYMKHIKNDYPYLFSIEMRRNIFGSGNDVVVK
jgi:hypothetical protein